MSTLTLNVSLEGGKYTIQQDENGKLVALRNGEPWRDLTGDKLVCALAHQVERLRDWIKAEGEHNDTCTYDVLRVVCNGCRCHRMSAEAKAEDAKQHSLRTANLLDPKWAEKHDARMRQ